MPQTFPSELLFASGNEGKYKEVSSIGESFGLRILHPRDLGMPGPPPEVEENAPDYLGNARLKAEAFKRWSGLPSLADDTGLEVDALEGGPGVHSARYSEPGATPARNIEKLLAALDGVSNRSARFYCLLYLALDERNHLTAEATLEGDIALERRGDGGFGYDSVFVVRGTGRTLAELKGAGGEVETHRMAACRRLFGILCSER